MSTGIAMLTQNPTASYVRSGHMDANLLLAAFTGEPWFTWLEVPLMKQSPAVRFGLNVCRAPYSQITLQEDKIQVPKAPQAAAFIQDCFNKFWIRGTPRVFDSYNSWGRGVLGMEYRYDRERKILRIKKCRHLEPLDVQPLKYTEGPKAEQFAGIHLRTVGRGRSGLKVHYVPKRYVFYYAGFQKINEYLDEPRLAGAYSPWREQTMPHGAIASRRLFYWTRAVGIAEVRFPRNETVTMADGSTMNAQDAARLTGERIMNGVVVALPNDPHPGMPGEYKWKLEMRPGQSDTAGVVEYADVLDKKIWMGLGIPDEIIAKEGGAYSGRAIPMETWLSGHDEQARMMWDEFREQHLERLMWINYRVREFDAPLSSLLKQFQEQSKKDNSAGGPTNTPPSNRGPGGGSDDDGNPAVDPRQPRQPMPGQRPAPKALPQPGQPRPARNLSTTPEKEPQHDPKTHDLHKAIALAMVEAALRKKMGADDKGDSDDLMQWLPELASDPAEAAAALGAKMLGWVRAGESSGPKHPGKPRWKDEATGKYRYQISRPGEHAERRAQAGQNATRGAEIVGRVVQGAHTQEELHELERHLDSMTVSQLRSARQQLRASFDNAKKRNQMVAALRNHIRGRLVNPPTPEPANPQPVDIMPTDRHNNGGDKLSLAPEGGKVEYVRAAAGGQTSDVDGKFYKGGQLMPVHGRYSGLPKTPKGEGVGVSSEPSVSNEDAEGGGVRRAAKPLSPEDLERKRLETEEQKKWDEMKSGPLGQFKWLGERVNSVALDPGKRNTRLDQWRQFAESAGPEAVKRVVDSLEPQVHAAIDRQAPDEEAADWYKQDLKRSAAEDVGFLKGGKGHENKVPGSHYARTLIHEMMDPKSHGDGTSAVDALHKVNRDIADALKPAEPVPEVKPTTPILLLPNADLAAKVKATAAAQEHGFGDNKVFISDVFDALKKEDPSLDEGEFKRRLIDLNRGDHLDLSRADLVQVMHPDDVKRSEVSHLNASFHLIRTDDVRPRKNRYDDMKAEWDRQQANTPKPESNTLTVDGDKYTFSHPRAKGLLAEHDRLEAAGDDRGAKALGVALGNLHAGDDLPDAEHRRLAARRLSEVYRHAHAKGDGRAMAAADVALRGEHVGAEAIGEKGATVPFDPVRHESDASVSTGSPVRVERHGHRLSEPNGTEYVVSKAKVKPAEPTPEVKPAGGLPEVSADAHQKPNESAYVAAGKQLLADDGFRKTVADAYNHQTLFVEHRDGLVPLPRLFAEVKKRRPETTLGQFHAAMDQLSRERAAQLHVLNEVRTEPDAHQRGSMLRSPDGKPGDERLYHYAMFNHGAGGAKGADPEKMKPHG